MKINGFNSNTEPLKVLSNYKKNSVTADKNKPSASKSDSLELSQEAQALQKYQNKLRELPESREEMVTELKEQIKRGTYKPDAQKIAEAIISERLLDKHV